MAEQSGRMQQQANKSYERNEIMIIGAGAPSDVRARSECIIRKEELGIRVRGIDKPIGEPRHFFFFLFRVEAYLFVQSMAFDK